MYLAKKAAFFKAYKLFDVISISFPKSKSFGFVFSFNQLNTWVVLIFLMTTGTGSSFYESMLSYS